MTLAAWLHDIDPVVLPIAGSLAVRWYGLAYLAGFAAAYGLLRFMCRRGMSPIEPARVFDIIVTVAICGMIGGRLGYVAVYQPGLLWSFTPDFPFWGLVALNRGGMASHGGFVGAVFGAWLIARKSESIGVRHFCDALAAAAWPGLLLGRIANFVNGELLGRVVAAPGEPAPNWAVRFPQEVLSDHPSGRTPAQQFELERLVAEVAPGEPFEDGYARVMQAVQRGSVEVSERLEPLLAARHPSQLYQAAAEGLVLAAVLWVIWRVPRTPGVITAWFLIVYGLLRIATEVVRLPDDHLQAARLLGLSRGQWLSVVMIGGGVLLLIYTLRRGGEKLGGWQKPALVRD